MKNKDLSIWAYVALALVKDKLKDLRKPTRQILMLAKKGIEFLLAQTEESKKEKEETKVKKIKIK